MQFYQIILMMILGRDKVRGFLYIIIWLNLTLLKLWTSLHVFRIKIPLKIKKIMTMKVIPHHFKLKGTTWIFKVTTLLNFHANRFAEAQKKYYERFSAKAFPRRRSKKRLTMAFKIFRCFDNVDNDK